jgi:asparaginyl-tRNA synthetase
MLEGEVVLDTLDELMDVVENGIRSVLTQMLGNGKRGEAFRRDLNRLSEGDDGIDGLNHLESTNEKGFHRMTYNQAIEELTAQHEITPFENEPDWKEGLPTEQEKWLAGKYGPTFITHYPKHLKPFYMLPSEADPSWSPSTSSSPTSSHASSSVSSETVSCFDLLFPHIGELAGGSMREHRLSELEKALDTHGLDKERYGWYLDLRRYGSVPHGGWGMGWDRWISWVTGVGNLKDVVAYPRWKGHCRY